MATTTNQIIEDRIQNVIIPREVARYLTHSRTFEESRLGPKTDAAEAKMESICLRAERGGYIDDLLAAITAARGY